MLIYLVHMNTFDTNTKGVKSNKDTKLYFLHFVYLYTFIIFYKK